MNFRLSLTVLLLTITVGTSWLAAEDSAFDAERLARIPKVMQRFVDDGRISGAVTLVVGPDGVVHVSSVGQADVASHRKMTNDALFRIASMTKPITATGLMILADEGKVSADDPVEKFIPAFRGQKLKDGSTARPVTIRDVMTHTAGLHRPNGQESVNRSLEETVNEIGQAPLAFAPGSKWQYSSGLDVAARVIEVISGQTYDDFLEERIFGPLGMRDTGFVLTEQQAARLATTYQPGAEAGTLAVADHWLTTMSPTQRKTPLPSGGLISTARDLGRFYQMILNGGELDGVKIVSQAAVNEMTRRHSPDDVVTGFTPGNGWGLGWCVVREPQGVSRLLSPGTFGHGGAFGTQAWLDPERKVGFVLLIQRTKFGNADGADIRDAFQEAAITAIRGRETPGARFTEYFNYDKAIELSNRQVKAVLSPQAGGRILEYSLNGKNSLYFDDAEKEWASGGPVHASAGRFDIGPELVIPRRDILWSGDWTGEITGPRSARLTSQHDPATGVQLVRDFVLDARTSKLACTQTIMNVSDSVKEWCHWSRTFATGEGICVIPLSDPSRFPDKYVMYEEGGVINARPKDDKIRVRDGFIEIMGAPRKPKLGFDSYAGWMGYVTRDNLLFVKRFATYPDRVYNEVAGLTISVWYPEGPRVELEPIGPRQRLQPGEVGTFTEEWTLSPFDFPASEQELDLKSVAERVATMTESGNSPDASK
jgi:CubicO group peptidase (beta-lactamase class C family)